MYIPKHYRVEDRQKLLSFMKEFSFATLVCIQDNVPAASHVPFIVSEDGEQVVLLTHLARQNPQWQHLLEGQEALVIFQEPHAYISPSLYEKELNVPTWNYCAVHAYGKASEISEPEHMLAAMERSITTYEPEYLKQFRNMPEKFVNGLLKGIVMLEIKISKLEGKYKLSQNKSAADRYNVRESMLNSSDSTIRRTGELMLEEES